MLLVSVLIPQYYNKSSSHALHPFIGVAEGARGGRGRGAGTSAQARHRRLSLDELIASVGRLVIQRYSHGPEPSYCCAECGYL